MTERRRHPRVESLNLVSVGEVDESIAGVARTIVVSEGGALLEMAKPYPIHTVFHLDLALDGELLSLEAEVRDVAAGEEGTYRVGVRFTGLSSENQARLDRFLAERRVGDG